MNKIRKGDQVIVLTGRDKGKRGAVSSRVDADHLLVEGVNVVKKHVKPNPLKGATGGIVDKTMPIHQSNVAIFNPATGTAEKPPKGGVAFCRPGRADLRRTGSVASAARMVTASGSIAPRCRRQPGLASAALMISGNCRNSACSRASRPCVSRLS